MKNLRALTMTVAISAALLLAGGCADESTPQGAPDSSGGDVTIGDATGDALIEDGTIEDTGQPLPDVLADTTEPVDTGVIPDVPVTLPEIHEGECTLDEECFDGNLCHVGICNNELCVFPNIDCNDQNPLTKDSCDSGKGCINEPEEGCDCTTGNDCEDGVYCTLDECKDCMCSHTPVEECDCIMDEDCDDSSLCTNELCLEGECFSDLAIDCQDADPCTKDACDPKTGTCVKPQKDCDDDDPCTIDSCDTRNGGCLHMPLECTTDEPCKDAACNPELGACEVTDRVCESLPCKEAYCNAELDTCFQSNVICNDGNFCTTDTCDVTLNDCIYTPIGCDDQDPCTIDFCNEDLDICAYDTKPCDDGDPSTTDSCDPTDGSCIHVP